MTPEEYRTRYLEQDAAPGWLAIDAQLGRVYADQVPRHFASGIPPGLGGSEFLNGVSLYWNPDPRGGHHHYVTYGFSELFYNEDLLEDEWSGVGFELSFRLKPFGADPEFPTWPVFMLMNLARYVFEKTRPFDEGHVFPTLGPIRLDTDTQITAVAFALDPELGQIETPHGRLKFLQLYGLTGPEYQSLRAGETTPHTLLEHARLHNPLLITDLERA